MASTPLQAEVKLAREAPAAARQFRSGTLRAAKVERYALTLSLAAVPISIAVAETLLAAAIVVRMFRCLRGETRVHVPRIFRLWLALAAAEILVWLLSPSLRDGWGEIRHLLLVGSMFFILPALATGSERFEAWKAVFLSSVLGSLFLIGDFVSRLVTYRREIAAGADVSFYLRTGGLLNNWMVYGTVEVLIAAGLLSFWFAFPEQRRRWWPVMALNAVAIMLSMTRTVWVVVFLLLALELWRKRSRWLLILPLLPLGVYFAAPAAIQSRIKVSMQPAYFSNAERIQMLQVGWRMVLESPWVGIGPGRTEKLYRSYLEPSDPVPKYHGHLHNNLAQMAAQFGIPATLFALIFAAFLYRELRRAARLAQGREQAFLARAGQLAWIGFLAAGLFDYTYGHSLALILAAFAMLSPLIAAVPESITNSEIFKRP
ncbi:MAG TPA: O-antigen ligase family protein [Candidatus Acidoferrales bacterium]